MLDTDRFNTIPKVKTTNSISCLPNPETADPESAVGPGRFPSWLHRPLPKGNRSMEHRKNIRGKAPPYCMRRGKLPQPCRMLVEKDGDISGHGQRMHAQLRILRYRLHQRPQSPSNADEPARMADSVQELGLKHVVITMVARDDLRRRRRCTPRCKSSRRSDERLRDDH